VPVTAFNFLQFCIPLSKSNTSGAAQPDVALDVLARSWLNHVVIFDISPSPFTFLPNQSHFPHPSKKSFEPGAGPASKVKAGDLRDI